MKVPLHKSVGFETLSPALARDVRRSIKDAIRLGAVLPGGTSPIQVFREAIHGALQKVETENGGQLLRFLNPGPYPDFQTNPKFSEADFLSDRETADAVNFVFGSMMNTFKGALAELLAAGPMAFWLSEAKGKKRVPKDARLFVGDAVLARQSTGRFAKAGDFYILRVDEAKKCVQVYGIGEVKSYRRNAGKVSQQIARNLLRSVEALKVVDATYTTSPSTSPRCFRVIPSKYKSKVDFKIEREGSTTRLVTAPVQVSDLPDSWTTVGKEHVLTLRWSQQALEEAAYGFTFWYMAELGSRAFSSGVSADWSEMSSEELGVNAAKSSLYYALMRLEAGSPAEQNAVALFNSYGFGYSVGMNFRNRSRKRVMLFFEDLVEILDRGYSILTVNGRSERRSIRGFRRIESA